MKNFPKAASYRLFSGAVVPLLERFLVDHANLQGLDLATSNPGAADRYWLLGGPELTVIVTCEATGLNGDYRIGLSFNQAAIAAFIAAQGQDYPDQAAALNQILPVAASPEAQADFTLALIESLNRPDESTIRQVCQPVQQALDQQQDRSLLLNQVVTKIRQSLELEAILETTVAEVRQFLAADRLLIYQFEAKRPAYQPPETNDALVSSPAAAAIAAKASHSGHITYESRADSSLTSVLHYSETRCFNLVSSGQRPALGNRQKLVSEHGLFSRYATGRPFAVNDVATTYRHAPCLLAFLQDNQVQSKLVAPILVNNQPWGLLIAHQCAQPRTWQPWELEFLQHIAEHLAVAINQAQLYSQLQQQTQNLEICVVERTHDLRDALAAAQTASRAKSEFLATMSHELRTPLTSIIGMSATLLRWSFGDLSPRQRDYLTTIHTSGEHLLTLINDILELSKIESGRTVLDISEFSLADLIRQSFDRFRPVASEREIQFSLEMKVPADKDLFAADPQRVRQILSNLLNNALKFTPTGGKVVLRARLEQQVAVFQIEDTGIGIPEAQQPLLFEKFQQLENARQRQYQGTGLGLALTKQLVDLHGGTVNVASKVGAGSVFTVRLPPQRWIEAAKQVAQSAMPEPAVGRIVLLEDQEDSAGLICDMLTAAEYQVIWVIEGSQVIEQVELLQPIAVIVNVNLTSTDGQDVIRALRRHSRARLRVLALVDAADSPQATQARLSGADEVLAKPIWPEALMTAVNSLTAMH